MREIYTARDTHEARAIQERLHEAGIRVVLRGEPLKVLGVSIPLGQVYPSICVAHDADAPRALTIIDEHHAAERTRLEGPAWKCQQCGESLEGQFTTCWSCGAPNPEPGGASE